MFLKGTKKSMRIGIVTTWFERGAAYVSKAYMDVLSQEHSVFIYARGGEKYAVGNPLWDVNNVTWAPRYGGFRTSRARINMHHFEYWLDSNDICVLIFNEEHDISSVLEANKLGIVTGAYIDYYREDNLAEFKNYDFLLCNTNRHYSVFKDYKNCIYIPWGTDTEKYRPKSDFDRLNSEVRFFHSAGMGGYQHRKGTDLVIDAFCKVKGAARLIVHSQKQPEYLGSEIVSAIKEDPRITFISKTVPAPGLYHLGDVFVYPSRLEGIGLCMAEALACGLPIIVPDESPMKDFVVEGHTGYKIRITSRRKRSDGYYWPVCEPDQQDLLENMQFYVDHPDLIVTHKRNARKIAVDKFEWSRNSAGLSLKIENIAYSCHKVRHRANQAQRLQWFLLAGVLKVNRWLTIALAHITRKSLDSYGQI